MHYVNLSGSAIYGLMARDFAPIETRLISVTSRLEQLPRFLRQARSSMEPARVPKIHAETAVEQNRGLVSIIETMVVPAMDALAADQRQRLEKAIEIAKDAVAEHQTWLEEDLLPRANGEFRIGAERYDAKLAFTLNSSLSRKEITEKAEAEYELVRQQMYDVAREVYVRKHPYTAFPDNPDEAYKQAIIRAALEEAYKKLPPPDGIVDIANRAQHRDDARGAGRDHHHARVSARGDRRLPGSAWTTGQRNVRLLRDRAATDRLDGS